MHVYLDAVHQSDLARFAQWFADPSLAALLSAGIAVPLGPEDELDWFDSARRRQREGRAWVFAIRRPEDAAAIGSVGLSIHGALRSGTLGIAIADPDARGHGHGGEALELLLRFAFDEVGLHRIELRVFAFNERACHLYLHHGFCEEGRLRDAVFRDGAYHDEIVMGLLEHEYRKRKNVAVPPGWIPADARSDPAKA